MSKSSGRHGTRTHNRVTGDRFRGGLLTIRLSSKSFQKLRTLRKGPSSLVRFSFSVERLFTQSTDNPWWNACHSRFYSNWSRFEQKRAADGTRTHGPLLWQSSALPTELQPLERFVYPSIAKRDPPPIENIFSKTFADLISGKPCRHTGNRTPAKSFGGSCATTTPCTQVDVRWGLLFPHISLYWMYSYNLNYITSFFNIFDFGNVEPSFEKVY